MNIILLFGVASMVDTSEYSVLDINIILFFIYIHETKIKISFIPSRYK